MGINLNGRSIDGNGITQDKFNEILKNSNASEKEKKAALDIFTKFAAMDNDKTTLSADEAKQAFAELQNLDVDNDSDVSKKELKQGKHGTDYQKMLAKAGKSAVELFYSSISGNTDVHLSKDEDGNAVVATLNGKGTATTKDDDFKMTVYDNTGEVKQEDNHEIPKQPKEEISNDDIQKTFLKYITNSNDFDGELFGSNTLDGFFAGDKPQLKVINENGKVGIEYNGKMYNMRGEGADIRFEYDGDAEKKGAETLQQAILNSKSDDAVHKYHNHGEAINSGSTYNVTKGTISHGTNKDSVSQSQTFASMLMNGNENSTLTLDKQRSKDGSFETTAEHIIKTLDSNEGGESDGEISMKELISYLKAAEVESNGLNANQATGARKFAKGVDLDLKDLANIGAVFKKYDTTGNGKLDKNELQNLLNALKKDSMSKLAKDAVIDKYKGDDSSKKADGDGFETRRTPKEMKANRTRNEVDINGKKTGQKIEYNYENGLRTVVKDGKEDLNGNIAEESDPTLGLGKKRFVYIEGLPTDVRAELKLDEESKSKIVEVKDRNGSVRYYKVDTNKTEGKDDTYKLGDELVKNGKKMVSRQQLTNDICKQLGIRGENIKLPDNITAEYGKNGKMTFKLNGRVCPENFARVAIMRANSTDKNPQIKNLDDGQRGIKIDGFRPPKGKRSIPTQLNYENNQLNNRTIDILGMEVDTKIMQKTLNLGKNLRDYLKNNQATIDNKQYHISSTKVEDKSGKVLLEFKDGKFYDAKGKEISEFDIIDILNKANGKHNLARIVQNFEQ